PFMSGALPPVERDHEVEATLAADEADPMSGRVVSAPESTEGTAGAESVDALVLPPVWEYHRSVPAVAAEVVKTETGVDSPVDRRDVSDVVEAHRNRLEEKLAAILPPYDGTAADCVVRLDAVRRGLFGGSVVARDDFAVGSRRPEDELTAAVGGDWRPVDGSLADVVRQVEELGHGAMAFVLTRPPGRTGHGFAVRNEGGIPLWLETQARPGSRVREVGQDLLVDARVIVVDATGRAVPLAAGSRAANTTDALLPPSAQRRYGARGAERTHDDVSGRGRTGDPEPADPSRASGGFQTRRVSSRRTGGRKPSGEPSRPGDGGLTFFPALPDSSGPRTTGHPGRDDLGRGQASSPHPLPIREKHSGRDALTRPVSRGSGQNAGSGFSRDDLGRGQRSAAASHQPEPNPSRSSSGYGSAEELRADLEREIKRAHPSGAVPDGGALGPDYFGLRDLPAPPDFVRGHNHRDLASWQVVELFERLDLTRAGAPSRDEMDPKKWPYRPERELRPGKKWSERYWANKLPPITTPLTLPRAMSSIWTGGPHVDDGFMTNLEKRAEVAHREGWSVVLLTDVPRIEFEAATLRNRPAGVSQGHFQEVARVRSRLREDHLRAVRRLWKRARDNGIWLVNIWEVRHRENPMRLHDAFVTELNKQIRPGYASTSDILRWENAVAFGLPYADPDDIVHTFKYLQDVLDSEDGYAIQKTNRGIANSVIVVPKGHPIAPVALEVINGNYRLRQKELAPHMSEEMEDLWKIFELDTDPSRIVRRYSTTMRSGPELLDKVAMAVGYDYLSDFPGAKGIEMGGAASWLRKPPTGTGRISSSDWRGTLEFAKRFFATMVRGRHNVRGDLNLVELSKALEKHDDPDLIWNATLSVFASRPELGGRIRSATTSRFENGGWHDVELPAEATRLLRYTGESIITENGDERQAVTMLSPAEVSRALIAEQASRRRDRDA
ncbi:MAG TPA: toxin glutamine deamidase domain-containing protein, partial [Amycolatopsis sp.]|nr:toxin glutamine deamidase domain-containing protein [Amycolatopsis sp.]